jgi:hypothetical protein
VSETTALHPLYYQDNFEQLCATVWEQYEDLLEQREKEFYDRYQSLDTSARCLYIRLVSRRGPLFRSEQLSYPELGDLQTVIPQLAAIGLLQRVESPQPELLLPILRKDELLQIYSAQLDGRKTQRKADLQAYLLVTLEPDQLVLAWRDKKGPDCCLLEVGYRDCVELLQLLFFGNRRQNLTEFVLSELGVVRYWDYSLDRAYRLFESRQQIDDYLLLGELRERYDEALENGDREAVLAAVDPLLVQEESTLLVQRRDRLRNRVARQLERYAQWSQALSLYRCSKLHPARERQVRILQGMDRYKAALKLCKTMEAEPWCEEERDFLRRQVPLLQKKLGQPCRPVDKDLFVEERLRLARSDNVEQAAADHYGRTWDHACYVENTLVNGAFGLALWEQIFLPLPGAFVNPFQSAPLDMSSPDFYSRRRAAIDVRLQGLADGDLQAELLEAYDRYFEISNRWVNWRYLPRELLQEALRLIPAHHWLSMWHRILFDPRANRSGFPDLLVLDTERGYCFIEIKGPGDQLQLNQKRWLRFFQQQGIPAKVAWVQWSDD